MKKRKFKAELHGGHKDDAVEVPFDPAATWGVAAEPLWRGRRGHRVLATLKGIPFEAFIVPRQQTFFLLIDEKMKQKAGVATGEIVEITVTPS